jgi:uncharacterized protein (DUF58 family)
MLYPDFDELIRLGQKVSHLQIISGRRSMAAGSGDYASPFRGQGLAFHEVREYRFGDDIRSIDWRVTARTDKPYVKVFTEERERTVILCVDANAAMRFGTRGTFKSVQAARATALLGSQASSNNDRVGCLVFGDVPEGIQFFAPARSSRTLWQALKLLSARAQGVHKTPVRPETALKYLERVAPTGALLLVIGDFQQATETLERQIGTLRRTCDVVLIAVNDPADREIPAMETVIFEDSAGRKLMLDTDNRAVRQAYAQQWREGRKRLEDIAARRGVAVVDLHTGNDVYADLLLGLRRLNIGKTRQ